jgi:hypothetical protein
MPTTPKEAKDHASELARIRANQKRSRARRAEYITSLESRLESCTRYGVELTAEIQRCALRVLEHNHRLEEDVRRLKEENGRLRTVLGEWERGEGERSKAGETYSAELETARDGEGQASELERLLDMRKACRPEEGRAGCGGGWGSNGRGVEVAAPQPVRASTASQTTPPDTASAFHGRLLAPQPLTEEPYPGPLPHIPAISPETTAHRTLPIPILPRDSQVPAAAPRPPPSNGGNQDAQSEAAHGQAIGTKSCAYAADMITSLSNHAEAADIMTALGCQPTQDGECHVNNSRLFEVMDRYS